MAWGLGGKQDKINHEEKHSQIFTLECNELVQIKTKYSEKIDYNLEKHLNMNSKYTQYTKSF